MSGGDFLRRMPSSSWNLRRQQNIWVRLHIDLPLLLLLLVSMVFGLVVLYSASGGDWHYVKRQTIFFLLGFALMFAVAQVNLPFLERWSWAAYFVGLGLLAAVLFVGVGAKGAQRWLSLGGFRFQPSEIMKLAVPLMIAAYLSKRLLPPKFKYIVVALLLALAPAFLILKQPDLGTALLIAMSGLVVLFFAGLPWRYIITALILVAASAWPAWHFVLHDYQRTRILTLLNPEADKLGAGWNIIQSKTAIGSGGWLGKGWLNGTQSQLDFLPESHTDFIIAVLAEEFGMRGFLCLLLLYSLILARGLSIAVLSQQTFSRLVAGSISFTLFVYIFVNIGMVSGLLPVVGVPLPFFSHGGTALLTLMISCGLLMAVATEHKRVGLN
ncbi:rod shape-determining protein RodA [Halioxenophilus sp. WMMB6]|uniref:rod shape-determining protein RodA n=1 Tax=Halioxenophilus sp. WMMB6 TaxID=3073815 RepID=UPI00295EEF45|nr:rod shape-determining protein RodA [Halioxenophilus sp. WMMB6]